MRILVVDDERPARDELRYLINEIDSGITVETRASGVEAVELLSGDSEFDGVFLDINMGDMSGLSVAMVAKRLNPELKIVFATAYDSHAVKAFELGAVDYVLKPFDKERIQDTLKRLAVAASGRAAADGSGGDSGNEGSGGRNTASSENEGHSVMTAADDSGILADGQELTPQEFIDRSRISVSSGRGITIIDIESISYVEAVNRGCIVHTIEGTELTDSSTLSSYEHRLMGNSFFKIHKSYLVNLNHLKNIAPWGGGYGMTLKGSENALPIGRSALKILRKIYGF